MQQKTVFIWVHRGKSSNNSVVEAQLSLPLTFLSLFSSLHCPQGDFYTEELNLFNFRETLGMQSTESQKNFQPFSPEANSILELLKLYFFFNGQTWNLPVRSFSAPWQPSSPVPSPCYHKTVETSPWSLPVYLPDLVLQSIGTPKWKTPQTVPRHISKTNTPEMSNDVSKMAKSVLISYFKCKWFKLFSQNADIGRMSCCFFFF